MRVVAGRLRGRALVAPGGRSTRPTSDRVRQAMFDVLAHGIDGFDLDGARVLDLFAGSGALGIEALSRGAAHALLVDDGAEARAAIRTNLEALGLNGVARIFRRDATRLGEAGTAGRFDLVLIDPPYGRGLGETALAAVLAGSWLAPGAVLVLEEAAEAEPVLPAGFELIDRRRHGDTQLLFLRLAAT